MTVDLKIPTVGESITEALVSQWFKKVGDYVEADEAVAELETDKVTLELPSPAAGVLSEILVDAGNSASVGDVIGKLDETAEKPAGGGDDAAADAEASDGGEATDTGGAEEADEAKEAGTSASESEAASAADSKAETPAPAAQQTASHVMPAAQRLIDEKGLDASKIPATGPGGRLLKEDVQRFLDGGAGAAPSASPKTSAGAREQERVDMTPIRRRIAERLVQAQQGAALLTTFNEIDMSGVMSLRSRFKEDFLGRHEVKLGFMSFFVKAAVDALREFPRVNAQIDGNQIVYNNFQDIGIAVSTDRGLMVPILRNAERMSFAEIEKTIADFGGRARSGKIKLEELEGGTFTISNGGIFGSLLSTPIVSPPQSGVLGLHAIQERPVAVDGEVVICPMMYVALTYDHRMVDGREAVTFLRRIKETVEEPSRLLLEA